MSKQPAARTTPKAQTWKQTFAGLVAFAATAVALNGPYLAGSSDRAAPLFDDVAHIVEQFPTNSLRPALEQVADNLGRDAALRRGGNGITVALIGNSLMENLAGPLSGQLEQRWDAHTSTDTALGAVLDDDLLIDWARVIDEAADNSDVVYVLLTPSYALDVDAAAWRAAAFQRVSAIAASLTDSEAEVFWLTPPYQLSDFEQRRDDWDTVLAAAGRGRITVVHTETVLDGGTGAYTATVDVGDTPTLVRDIDGVHLTAAGAELVASHITQTTATALDAAAERSSG